jgi:glycerol-3-phosphate acyltransferase PlsX
MAKIAVDMMGSDLGPQELSQAVRKYLADQPEASFLLFGDEKTLTPLFSDLKERVSIVPTASIIPMEIKPLDFLRSKDSSLYQAIDSVKEGRADAVLTAGSTGGFVIGSTMLLRNIEGVTRAGICSPFPTAVKGRATVILDIGASNVNTAEDLYGFAKMGSLYASEILDLKNPSVYVLSNGTEEGKGTEEVVKAYELLKERNFPGFEGNVEARDALDGKHDVIVTSGFTGNVFLKAVEGTASMMNGMIKDAFKTSFGTKIGYLFAKKGFKEMKTRMDYRKYGGAILLGVNGVAVKAHGNSNAYAFYHAIDVAEKMAEKNIVNRIREAFHD